MSETKKEMLSLDSFKVENLVELSGWEQKQKDLVEENPFIEITDNATYEEAKKRRTALVKGRTALENQDKVIASKFTGIRKMIMDKTKSLISLSLPHEEKQQAEVKRHEAILEEKRLEKERKEQERIDNIKSKISEIESKRMSVVQSLTFEGIGNIENSTWDDVDFDFEEYDILFQQAELRVQNALNEKISDLKHKEEEKQERERLRLEAEENARKLAELQAQQEKERLEREEKERKEKEAIFEVRKNRLIDMGFSFNGHNFIYEELEGAFTGVNKNFVFEKDIFQFEDYVNETKAKIEKVQKELQINKLFEERVSELLSYGLSMNPLKEEMSYNGACPISHFNIRTMSSEEWSTFLPVLYESINEYNAKEKAKDKENKARQKAISADKKKAEKLIDSAKFDGDLLFISKDEKLNSFIDSLGDRLQDLKDQLLTELNNI